MHIEPEAREIILNVLESKGYDSIKIDIINDNGRDTISLEVGNARPEDNAVNIDGVQVIISEEILAELENVVFISDNGRLSIVQLGGCGCGCGCGGHDSADGGCGCEGGEGGCGCGGHEGHSHSHEGGCGCGHHH